MINYGSRSRHQVLHIRRIENVPAARWNDAGAGTSFFLSPHTPDRFRLEPTEMDAGILSCSLGFSNLPIISISFKLNLIYAEVWQY